MDTEHNEQKRKPGRPRKLRNFIIYRSGRKLKAWNTDLRINMVPNEREISEAVLVYDGLGEDWVYHGRKLTRDGDYNIATRFPFRKPDAEVGPVSMQILEDAIKREPVLREFVEACTDLFDGRIPHGMIVLSGVYWMRTLSGMFIRDAGVAGLSRTHYERITGKIWGAANVFPTHGSGYNYSLDAWKAIINAEYPCVFAVKIEDEDPREVVAPIQHLNPKELANAILHSLWATKGVNSCDADASAPDFTPETMPDATAIASEEATTSILPSEDTPMLSGDPDAVPAASAFIEECAAMLKKEEPEQKPTFIPLEQAFAAEEVATYTTAFEAGEKPSGQTIPEATPTQTGKTWGEIKQTQIWMKGLSTSKDLQAPALLSRILDTVVSHEATKRLTEDCRAITDKKERNEFKRDNLHVWYPSAVFAGRVGGSNKGNLIGYTGLACLDFDGIKSQEEAENMRDDLFMEFPEVLFAAVSASGLGVYVLVTLNFDGSEAGFKLALSSAMEAFEAKGYMPDTGCSDATRARYMSSDADALSRPDSYMARAFSAGEEGAFILPASMLRMCWTNSGRKRKGAGKAYLEEALHRIEQAPDGMRDTTITSVMGSVARLIRNYDMNAEQVYAKVMQVATACGYDTSKTRDKIRRLGVKNEGGSL